MGADVFKWASIFITTIISFTVLYIVIKYIKKYYYEMNEV